MGYRNGHNSYAAERKGNMSETVSQKIQNDFDRIALLEQVQWNH